MCVVFFFAGFVEFGPEIAGTDQKTKLLLSSQDLVCVCLCTSVHLSVIVSLSSEEPSTLCDL